MKKRRRNGQKIIENIYILTNNGIWIEGKSEEAMELINLMMGLSLGLKKWCNRG